MKKAVILSVVLVLTSFLIKRGTEAYVNRGADYPEGPTVNGEGLFVDYATNTFYTSANMEQDSLFTGISLRFHPNGELLVKGGIKNGKLHGPFDAWYANGQKQMTLIWKNGKKFRRFRAFLSNGDRIEGGNEIGHKVFSGEIILE